MLTIVTSLTRQHRIVPRHRAVYTTLISAVALTIALAATANFLATFTDFMLFLLYFMTPWSAVNLVDYYWVRREQYNIDELFQLDGSYGRFNKGAFCAYIIGVIIQIPFMNSALYVGPIAHWLGGAELAWLLGLVVSGGLYYLFSRGVRNGEPARRDSAAPPQATTQPQSESRKELS